LSNVALVANSCQVACFATWLLCFLFSLVEGVYIPKEEGATGKETETKRGECEQEEGEGNHFRFLYIYIHIGVSEQQIFVNLKYNA